MASQTQPQMWDDLRAYVMQGAPGYPTQAQARRMFRVGALATARADADAGRARARGASADAKRARQRLKHLREQRAYAAQREADRQADRQQHASYAAQRFANAQADRQQHASYAAQRFANAQADRQQRLASQAQAAQTRLDRQQQQALAQARQQRLTSARGLARFAQQMTPDRVQQAGRRLASLPTPGGLGGVIAALVFFNLAVVPVGPNGETRLWLLWQTITGAVALPSTTPIVGGPAGNVVGNQVDTAIGQATGQNPATVAGIASGLSAGANAAAAGNPILAPIVYGGDTLGQYLRGLGAYVP